MWASVAVLIILALISGYKGFITYNPNPQGAQIMCLVFTLVAIVIVVNHELRHKKIKH